MKSRDRWLIGAVLLVGVPAVVAAPRAWQWSHRGTPSDRLNSKE